VGRLLAGLGDGAALLVVALPAAGAAMACAQAPLFRRVGAPSLAVALFGVAALATGLYAAALTVHVPHIALTSALPAVLERRLRQPLTEWLPALGGYAVLEPGHAELGLASLASAADTTISGDGQALFAQAGQAGLFAQWPPVRELPFGLVSADLADAGRAGPRGPAGSPACSSSRRLARRSPRAPSIRASSPRTALSAGRARVPPGPFDAWSRPLDIAIFTTGRADLWSGGLRVDPDPAHGSVWRRCGPGPGGARAVLGWRARRPCPLAPARRRPGGAPLRARAADRRAGPHRDRRAGLAGPGRAPSSTAPLISERPPAGASPIRRRPGAWPSARAATARSGSATARSSSTRPGPIG
jgi:hypothetical protein